MKTNNQKSDQLGPFYKFNLWRIVHLAITMECEEMNKNHHAL